MNTFQRKLTLIITLTSFFALLVAGIFFVGFDYLKFKETQVKELQILSEVIGKNSIAALDFNDSQTGSEILSMLKGVPQIDNAVLLDKSGDIFASYSRDSSESHRLPSEPFTSGTQFKGQYLSLYTEINDTNRLVGYIYLIADLSTEQERWNRYIWILVAMGFLALFIAVVVGYKLQNIISKPVSLLSDVASKVTKEKDYSIRAKEQGVDEIRNLITAFNDMLEKIEERSRERDFAEEKLREHRDHLEELVSARTQALEHSNKELEAFSYSVSHDLRAPIRSINGFCQLLLEEYGDQLDETAKDYLRRTQNSALKMESLIAALLQLSRISRHEFVPHDYNLSEMVQEAITKNCENVDQSIAVAIEPNIHCKGDIDLLSIALDNLVSNAIKYSSKQDNPKIEFGITKTEKSSRTYFIRDNGVGFDMKYADSIFVAFKRLHTDSDFPGSGVGLATVSRIIKRHDGEIWVYSEEGMGTTFYFTLGLSTCSSDASVKQNKTGSLDQRSIH